MELIIIYFEIYVILVLALNLQLGFSGLMNFSTGIFYGTGAYIFAIALKTYGLNFYESIGIAILGNVLLSIPISLAAVRFKNEVFVLITIAFQIITLAIISNINSTGGVFGLNGIPQHRFFSDNFSVYYEYAIVGAVFIFIVAGFSFLLYRLPFCRSLQSIRDNPSAAAALGKNIIWFQIRSVAISCGLIAFAGALRVSAIPALFPNDFGIGISVDVILILVLGGMGNVKGAIIGSFIFFAIEDVFRRINLNDMLSQIGMKSSEAGANLRIILFCLVLIIIMYKFPKGILGKFKLKAE